MTAQLGKIFGNMKKIINTTKIAEAIAIILIVLQGLTDLLHTMPVQESTVKIVAAVIMLLTFIVTASNQYLNEYISNKSLWLTLILFIGYIAGGITDYLNFLSLSPNAEAWLRFAISAIVLIVNLTSKLIFPNANKATY